MLGKKGGVYLMKHPDQLRKIVKALREEIKLPFSVKIRSGWDPQSINAVEVSKMLEKEGVDAITVHARTRKELYKKRADWTLVRKVKETVKVPIILSGDVTNPYMAHMAFMHTKCDFVMVARGAMNNPSIFSYLNDYLKEYNENKTEPSKPFTTYEKNKEDVILDFEEFLKLYKKIEKRYRFSELQDHAIWSVREAKNNSDLKQEIINSKTEQELKETVRKTIY
ncbi:MAG: tRNA dihydrouridine synthase [Candidatus Woesearchaeota archaeon]